jgi:hypothetical protein
MIFTPFATNINNSGIRSFPPNLYLTSNFNSFPYQGNQWINQGGPTFSGFTGNATLFNTPTFTNASPSFFTFNGTNQYASTGSNYSAQINDSGFGMWFKMPTGSTEVVLFQKGIGDELVTGWSFRLSKTNTNNLKATIVLSNPSFTVKEVTSTTTIISDIWYYVFCNLNLLSTTRFLKIYVNGLLQATTSWTVTSTPRTSTTGFIIGNDGGSNYFNGSIGEFQYYLDDLFDVRVGSNFGETRGNYRV